MEQIRKQSAQFAPPVMDSRVAAPSSRTRSTTALKRTRKRALIVEAAPSSLRLCREILKCSGFVIELAGTGIAALTSARENRPDLIVMDLQRPDVPGREFIGWLRDVPALRSTPIIILAGAAGDSAELAELGSNAFLRRPASALMINRAIREVMKSN